MDQLVLLLSLAKLSRHGIYQYYYTEDVNIYHFLEPSCQYNQTLETRFL